MYYVFEILFFSYIKCEETSEYLSAALKRLLPPINQTLMCNQVVEMIVVITYCLKFDSDKAFDCNRFESL